jgi:hypothetical protein
MLNWRAESAGEVRAGARTAPAACYDASVSAWRCTLYCPQCGVEYREGFSECADCLVPLVTGDPQKETDAPAAGAVELVTVLETGDWVEISLVGGVLHDAGIACAITAGKDISNQGVYFVQVAKEDEADARAVLAPPDQAELANEAEEAGSGEETP